MTSSLLRYFFPANCYFILGNRKESDGSKLENTWMEVDQPVSIHFFHDVFTHINVTYTHTPLAIITIFAQHLESTLTAPPPPPTHTALVIFYSQLVDLNHFPSIGCRFLKLMLIIRQPPAFQYLPQMNCTQPYAYIYVCH